MLREITTQRAVPVGASVAAAASEDFAATFAVLELAIRCYGINSDGLTRLQAIYERLSRICLARHSLILSESNLSGYNLSLPGVDTYDGNFQI